MNTYYKRLLLLLAVLTLIGIGMRGLAYRRAFHKGLVFFFGSDAWCHIRRMSYAADNNFKLPEPDSMLNYPEGTFTYWGGLYDWMGAAVIKISGAPEGLPRERTLAWLPAVLGALCAIPAFFLGALLIPKAKDALETKKEARGPPLNITAGFLTGLFAATLPGHAEYSMLGHLDHHVLESLLFGSMAASLAALKVQEGERGRKIWTVISSGAFILMYLQHPAISNIYAGILWAACMACILFDGQTRRLWIPFLAPLILLLPMAFYYFNVPPVGLLSSPVAQLPNWMLFQQYSFLQPVFLTFLTLTLLAAQLFRGSTLKTPTGFLLIAGILACAAFLALPVAKGFLVLVRADPLLRFTAESMPILFPHTGSGFKPVFAHEMFGYLFLAFPFAWAWVWKKQPKRDYYLLSVTAALFVLVMLQLRFVYLFTYAFALALAWAFQEASSRFSTDSKKKNFIYALILLSFVPSVIWWYKLHKGSRFKYLAMSDAQYDMYVWMRQNTPEVAGFKDVSQKPKWSVLGSWDSGHYIVYLGRRAVVADPLNHGMVESMSYYDSYNPREAVQILLDKNVKYVAMRDMSEPVTQEMDAGSLNLPADHPVRTGEWMKLFQMRLITQLPVAGPDGHPFQWGHRLVYLSPDGKEGLFEFNAEAVKKFKPRMYSRPGEGILASVGRRQVTEQDVKDWQNTQGCYPNRKVGRQEAFMHAVEMAVMSDIFSSFGLPWSAVEEAQERIRIDQQTKAPEILSCIKKAVRTTARYEEIFIRPLLSGKRMEQIKLNVGFEEPGDFLRSYQPKIPYKIYDSKLEAYFIEQLNPFLGALDHSGGAS